MAVKISKLCIELNDRLKAICNEKDFVVGVLSLAYHEDDRKELLNYLNDNPNASTVDISVKALNLMRAREGGPIYNPEGGD